MKLFVPQREVQDAVIPIRWCLNRKELGELKEKGVKNPHLLLVIVHKDEVVNRYLIPLDQMLTYVQFHKPGENRILATIVWNWEKNTYKLKKYFLERYSSGSYRNYVLDYTKKSLLISDLPWLEQQTEITVVVPPELFAKEPPAWEKWWVNLWHETKPRDQCQFRKRRMIAYTIQPPLVLLWTIIITIFRFLTASVLLFLGKRGVDLKPIIYPFKYHSSDVWDGLRTSVFVQNADRERQPWLITFFSPLSFLGFLAILVGIRFIFPSFLTLQWRYYPLGAVAVMAGIVAVVYTFFALFIFIPHTISRLILKALKASVPKSWSERKKARQERAREEREKKELEEAEKRRRKEEQLHAELEQLLACNGEFTPRLSALPKEKQTIFLRFQDLKAKVCKPFAR